MTSYNANHNTDSLRCWTQKNEKIIGCNVIWTGVLSHCSFTAFQNARKADSDISLAVVLSCCIWPVAYYMTSHPMNINHPWKAPVKTCSYLLSSLHMKKILRTEHTTANQHDRMDYRVTVAGNRSLTGGPWDTLLYLVLKVSAFSLMIIIGWSHKTFEVA